ncbi:hypothetical protein [Spirosoma agri]|uniref:Uncharacterized protein n=1 Tax=Spirosoma agri TaxID=1987381 RepID=A0A6M0IHP1_9BACT|nr:hypothetical protein [Spirosoma agri]NEU67789.1 hypothetical protein [Spirosoma agri]
MNTVQRYAGKGRNALFPTPKAQNAAKSPQEPDARQLLDLLTTFFRSIKRVTITVNVYSEINQVGNGNVIDSCNVRTTIVQKGGQGNV